MLPHKAASFETIVALLTLVTLLIKTNSHTSEVEIHPEETLCHFGRYVVKTKLSYLIGWSEKAFIPVSEIPRCW